MGRAPCCDKSNVKKGPWAPEEDAKLKAYIEEHGTGGNWIALPQKIGLKRCGKSCRLRWLNYLRPNIKHGGFSEEEDHIICSLYISIGSRWSIIAAQLPGRTDNDIKNYWNTRLKKKLLGKRRESASQSRRLSGDQEANGMTTTGSSSSSHALSASALERMQLHMQLQAINDPFAFYNQPALWPKLHPLGERFFHSQQTAGAMTASAAAHTEQIPDTAAQIDPSHQNMPMKSMAPNSRNVIPQEEFSQNSNIEFSSPSMEHANSSFNSVAAGLQAELHGLLYTKNGSHISGQDLDHELSALDCFKEMNDGRDGFNWWANNGFELDKSSASSWDSTSALQPDAMLNEYVLGYDL